MSPAVNTLSEATSPYLRQHADNPVHWQQWTPEALAEAASRDVPILLSIGYAACHWCHVMAHESFEDEQVAAAMNDGFVNIKVDREERPDLDAVYMNATVALTGQGGWPMTCFLTPDGRPFFCGTYYPKPNFLQLLAAVAETWRTRRDEVEQASDRIADELRSMASGLAGGGPPVQPALCDHAVAAVLQDEDPERGGFGGAPKFPPSALLEALLRSHERTGDMLPLETVERTCTAMARGGIYDQLAGGFARYSVDASWVVPHFEKMLYDNALLLRVYAHWARRTSNPLARTVTGETARFMIDELGAGGMFTSSLDADTDGREGLTYVWTPAQLREVLGDDDGRWAASVFNVTDAGTFEHGSSVLQLPADPDDAERFERVRTALLAARLTRPQPGRDDKVVTAWNGLAITALAEASVALGRPEFLDAATQCARGDRRPACRGRPVATGQPRRPGRRQRGDPRGPRDAGHRPADAASADRRASWLDAATGTARHRAGPFRRPGPRRPLVRQRRRRRAADGAARRSARRRDAVRGVVDRRGPAAGCPPGARGPADRYAAAADATLASATPILARLPRSGGHWLAVAEAAVRGPIQIAVACDPARSELLAAARDDGAGRSRGGRRSGRTPSELLLDRDRVDGADAAYVCRGRVCDLPVTTAEELAAALGVAV